MKANSRSRAGPRRALAIIERGLDLREAGAEALEQDGFLVRHI